MKHFRGPPGHNGLLSFSGLNSDFQEPFLDGGVQRLETLDTDEGQL
jgi:hypothetical protein